MRALRPAGEERIAWLTHYDPSCKVCGERKIAEIHDGAVIDELRSDGSPRIVRIGARASADATGFQLPRSYEVLRGALLAPSDRNVVSRIFGDDVGLAPAALPRPSVAVESERIEAGRAM